MLNCAKCEKKLTELTIKDLKVDTCESGCGGVWFDAAELKKVDEKHEVHGNELLNQLAAKDAGPTTDRKGRCPRCATGLRRYFFTPEKTFEVDECAQCGGIWLDAGELKALRDLPGTEADRKEKAAKAFETMFAKDLTDIAAQSKEEAAQAQRIARFFRVVLPSYWLPGKQSGGAY